MTRAGPLPGIVNRTRPLAPAGVWRGVVEAVSPDLVVSVPSLTGQGAGVGRCIAVADLALLVGDRVWVGCVEGSRSDLVVLARRDPLPPPPHVPVMTADPTYAGLYRLI